MSSIKKSPKVINLGCRLNFFESEVIKNILDTKKINDMIVVNTCAVTNLAVSKSISEIRKAARENPDSKIIVTGCASQVEKNRFLELPNVYNVVDNNAKTNEFSYLNSKKNNKKLKYKFPFFNEFKSTRTRATLQIQQGCNHRCTFCIIPYGRGDALSLPVGEINYRLKKILEDGYKEVTLTGIDLTSYGEDLPGKPRLGNLIKRILIDNPNLKRLRLSSIDPAEIDDELFYLMINEKRLLPHFHLSIQSGDNLILKRMKRRHNREEVINLCKKIKKVRKDVTFGADIIVGFPTEKEEHFQNTLDLIETCQLSNVHVFPFSPKSQTPASKMPQVCNDIKNKRIKIIREKCDEILERLMNNKIGDEIRILFETKNLSYTDDFFKVSIKMFGDRKVEKGELIEVKVIAKEKNFLRASF